MATVRKAWTQRLLAITVGVAVASGAVVFAPSPAGADGTPLISVGNATIHEGDAGTRIIRVMVNLDRVSSLGVTTKFFTTGGSATQGVDFKARSGSLYFKPGQVTRYVKVVVKSDLGAESDEQFNVHLSNVVGAIVADASGTATIIDDEATTGTVVSAGDATVVEGVDGTSRYVFVAISLNQPAGVPASVSYATGGGTAVSPFDYSDRTGTINFRPKARVMYALIYVTPDEVADGTKTFNVTLSSPVNMTIGDGSATVTLLDDD
jgi:chitinase